MLFRGGWLQDTDKAASRGSGLIDGYRFVEVLSLWHHVTVRERWTGTTGSLISLPPPIHVSQRVQLETAESRVKWSRGLFLAPQRYPATWPRTATSSVTDFTANRCCRLGSDLRFFTDSLVVDSLLDTASAYTEISLRATICPRSCSILYLRHGHVVCPSRLPGSCPWRIINEHNTTAMVMSMKPILLTYKRLLATEPPG